jgi:hypothetical protein
MEVMFARVNTGSTCGKPVEEVASEREEEDRAVTRIARVE